MEEEHISQIVADVKVVYDLDRLRKEVDDPSLTLLNYVIGDVINTCPIRLIATTYAEASQQVFLYSFNHHHDRARLPPWVGAMHGFEIPFVFGSASVDSEEFSPREADLSQTIMTLWANFAKFGQVQRDSLVTVNLCQILLMFIMLLLMSIKCDKLLLMLIMSNKLLLI